MAGAQTTWQKDFKEVAFKTSGRHADHLKKRADKLAQDGHITRAQAENIKGHAPERLSFELKAITEHVAAGSTVDDEFWAQLDIDAGRYYFKNFGARDKNSVPRYFEGDEFADEDINPDLPARYLGPNAPK